LWLRWWVRLIVYPIDDLRQKSIDAILSRPAASISPADNAYEFSHPRNVYRCRSSAISLASVGTAAKFPGAKHIRGYATVVTETRIAI
jgi:hypothetical protein